MSLAGGTGPRQNAAGPLSVRREQRQAPENPGCAQEREVPRVGEWAVARLCVLPAAWQAVAAALGEAQGPAHAGGNSARGRGSGLCPRRIAVRSQQGGTAEAPGRWHPSRFQPPLKGYPGFSGNRLPCIMNGSYRPPLGGGGQQSGKLLDGRKQETSSTWGFTAERGRSIKGLDEEKPLIRGGRAFGYPPNPG
jgi:hypothetical protein